MIEIIKKGIIKHNLSCPECDCKFLYTADEVTGESIYDDFGTHCSVAIFFYIKCPFCNHTIYVDERDFTEEELNITKRVLR